MFLQRALVVSLSALMMSSCAVFQPPPRIIERNYDAATITRRVALGHALNIWPPLKETHDDARERLVAAIAAECPRYQLVAEGTDQERGIRQAMNLDSTDIFDTVAKPTRTDYVWVRYRCPA